MGADGNIKASFAAKPKGRENSLLWVQAQARIASVTVMPRLTCGESPGFLPSPFRVPHWNRYLCAVRYLKLTQ